MGHHPRSVPANPSLDSLPAGSNRYFAALAVALVAGGLAFVFRFVLGQSTSDFDQIIVGINRALHGTTPYTSTALPGLTWPIYYPMPALVLGLPFIGLSSGWAQVAFCSVSGAAFGWGMSADGDAKLFGLATWPFVLGVSLGQWTMALMAAAAIPWLGWLALAKPNLGFALGVAYGDRWVKRPMLWTNLGIGMGLIVISFAIRPTWFVEWLGLMKQPKSHIIAPVTALGGPLLLLGLLRWRRAEGRLLAALACVPQTFSSYDSLLVFLTVRTRRQALILVAASGVVTAIIAWVGTAPTYGETVRRFAPIRIALLYVPALVMVIWPATRSAKDKTRTAVEGDSPPPVASRS